MKEKEIISKNFKRVEKNMQNALSSLATAVSYLEDIEGYSDEMYFEIANLITCNTRIAFNQVKQFYYALTGILKIDDESLSFRVKTRATRLAEMKLAYFEKHSKFMEETDEKEKISLKRDLIELEMKIKLFEKMLFDKS